MSTNCLVTALKGTVSDPEYKLRKVGEMHIKAFGTGANSLAASSVSQVAKIINGNYTFVASGEDELTITTGQSLETQQGALISIPNKYALTSIRLREQLEFEDISELAYCNSLQRIYFNDCVNMVGDISVIGGLQSLLIFDSGNCPLVTGDIATFAKLPSLTQLSVSNFTKLTGNISSLGTMTGLTMLNMLAVNLIEGTLESLCEGMCANGRTSGNLNFRINNGVTFNGNKYTGVVNFSIDFTATGCTVTVNSQTSTYTKSTGTWTYPS